MVDVGRWVGGKDDLLCANPVEKRQQCLEGVRRDDSFGPEA